VVWGVLHLGLGVVMISGLLSTGLPADTASARGVMFFWCVIVFGVLAAIVGVALNWRNDPTGYWINLFVVTAVDAGFVLFMMVPGNVGFAEGISGPAAWFGAAVFSTLGRLGADGRPVAGGEA
jgi:hypothetical protein